MKYNQPEVKLTKIINDIPYATIWLYWETDITFITTDIQENIIVRTHDKRLTYNSATINDEPIPIGLYPIYTDNNGTYSIHVNVVGYVNEIQFTGEPELKIYEESIPNEGEVYIEWYAEVDDIKPIYQGESSEAVFGVDYEKLIRRV